MSAPPPMVDVLIACIFDYSDAGNENKVSFFTDSKAYSNSDTQDKYYCLIHNISNVYIYNIELKG